jgi:hypothetical protein
MRYDLSLLIQAAAITIRYMPGMFRRTSNCHHRVQLCIQSNRAFSAHFVNLYKNRDPVTYRTINTCAPKIAYVWPGQTFADQELLLIFTESRGPPPMLIFLVVYGKTQEISNNNNNNNNNLLILIIRSK